MTKYNSNLKVKKNLNELIKVAIDLDTNKYVNSTNAQRCIKYKCPHCGDKVTFKSGKIIKPYFSHTPNVGCCYYSKSIKHCNITQIYTYTKYLLKSIIDSNNAIIIKRNNSSDYIIDCNNRCVMDYPFIYNNTQKTADIAILDNNNNIKYIFELSNINNLKEGEIFEPWFEITIENVNNYFIDGYLYCNRNPITLDNMDEAINIIKHNKQNTELCDKLLNCISNAIDYDLRSYF